MKSDIKSLTAIRGIACLTVVAGHLSNALPSIPNLHIEFIGVMLFFCLSGFLLAYLYAEINDVKSLKKYACRRFLRIYPIFAVTVILLGMFLWFYPNLEYKIAPKNINVLSVLTFEEDPWVFWSVRVEVFFYIIFPIIAFILLLTRDVLGKHFVLIIILLLYVTLHNMSYQEFNKDVQVIPRLFHTFFRSEECFIAGMFAGYAYNIYGDYLKRYVNFFVLCSVFLFCCYIISFPTIFKNIFGFLPHGYYSRSIYNYSLPLSLIMSALLLCIAIADKKLSVIFHNRPIIFIGKISFGIYLVHCFFINLYLKTNIYDLTLNTRILFALILTVLLAYALHLLVELPCIALAKKIK